MEEVHLQDYLAARRSRARVLQVAQLPGAARIGGGSLHAALKHESLLRGRLMWTDDVYTTRQGEEEEEENNECYTDTKSNGIFTKD